MLTRALQAGLRRCCRLCSSSSSSGNSSKGSSAGSLSPPAHWDRTGGSAATITDSSSPKSSSPSPSALPSPQEAPVGVALATHMLLNQPTYNVLGDVAPVNEYHLVEETAAGVPYHALPIVYLGARRNNCIATLADNLGRPLACTSTGVEGFANAKKSTTVAAQVVGVSIALKAKKLGILQARVVIRGMNQLRLACLKGMASGGLQIASLTDNTKIHYGKGRRPRKPPRK